MRPGDPGVVVGRPEPMSRNTVSSPSVGAVSSRRVAGTAATTHFPSTAAGYDGLASASADHGDDGPRHLLRGYGPGHPAGRRADTSAVFVNDGGPSTLAHLGGAVRRRVPRRTRRPRTWCRCRRPYRARGCVRRSRRLHDPPLAAPCHAPSGGAGAVHHSQHVHVDGPSDHCIRLFEDGTDRHYAGVVYPDRDGAESRFDVVEEGLDRRRVGDVEECAVKAEFLGGEGGRAGSRSPIATCAPAFRRAAAVAQPMPRAPPVTTATRPIGSIPLMCASLQVIERAALDLP